MASAVSRPIVCPRLIGRAQPLDALASALDEARRGAGRTVLISGEAGIGKSRLVTELAALACRAGLRTLAGACYEADRSTPFAPLLDLLQASLTPQDEEALRRIPSAATLMALFPELAARLPGLPVPPLSPEQSKRRLFSAFSDLVLALARTCPVLVTIEDIHWADDTSLELLLHLARATAHAPVLLAVTYRGDEVHPALRHLLAELDRERLATEIALAPLAAADVGAMLQAIFDLPRPARGELPEALHALTEGNPFFIEEVLHVLVADGGIYAADGKWERKPLRELRIPRSVRDSVQRRRARISPAAAAVLELAAVVGRRFDFAVLQQVGGYDEAQLLACVKELIGAQLVVEESADRFAFRHALTRQAVYSELLARERRALHRAVADALERASADAAEPPLADLAYHAFEAGAWEQAMRYARCVGEEALAVFALPAAVEHFTRALLAAERLGVEPPIAVLRLRGQAYGLLGEFARAQADLDAALARAEAAGATVEQWHLLRELGFLWSGHDYERAGEYYRRAYDLARAAGDRPMLARSMNSLGNWLLNVDQPHEARRYHEQALAAFEEIGDHAGAAQTLDLLSMTLYLSGDPHAAAQAGKRAAELLRARNDRMLLTSTLATLGLSAPSWQTDMMVPAASLPAAIGWVREAVAIAREIAWAAGEAYALLILSYHLGSHGDYAAAFEAQRLGEEIAREIEHRQWLCALGCVHGVLRLDLFALAAARDTLADAYRLARALGSQHWIRCVAANLALAHLRRGATAAAAAVLDDVLPPTTPMASLGQRLAWCVRIELALASDDPAQALRLADALADATPNARHPGQIPRVSWLRGRALLALRRYAEAEAALLAAAELAETCEARTLLWRVRADLVDLQLAWGRRDAAAATAAAGLQLVESLAATIPDPALRDGFLAAAAARFPHHPLTTARPARERPQQPGGLTPREREVAVLVARGLSNRAIAAALVVGERTVETHVTNILGKLGFTSRAQIAAWAVEHGLLTA